MAARRLPPYEKLKAMRENGVTYATIAKKYKVSKETVAATIRRDCKRLGVPMPVNKTRWKTGIQTRWDNERYRADLAVATLKEHIALEPYRGSGRVEARQSGKPSLMAFAKKWDLPYTSLHDLVSGRRPYMSRTFAERFWDVMDRADAEAGISYSDEDLAS